MEAIPPTTNAMSLHLKISIYQGSCVWGQVLQPKQSLPSPTYWEWQRRVDSTWELVWTTLPSVSKACHELIKCGSNPEKGCIKSNLPFAGLMNFRFQFPRLSPNIS